MQLLNKILSMEAVFSVLFGNSLQEVRCVARGLAVMERGERRRWLCFSGLRWARRMRADRGQLAGTSISFSHTVGTLRVRSVASVAHRASASCHVLHAALQFPQLLAAASCTAGAPGYLKSMWTSASAGCSSVKIRRCSPERVHSSPWRGFASFKFGAFRRFNVRVDLLSFRDR